MRYIWFGILSAIFGGTIGIFVKLLGNDIPLMTLNFYRVFFAFVFIAAIVPFLDKSTFKVKKNDIPGYILAGFLVAISIITYTVANWYAPIQNVVILGNIAPFVVFILAYFVLGEKVTARKIIALLIGVVGLIIINPFNTQSSLFGNLLAILNGVIYGITIVWLRREDRAHSIGSVFWFFLFASIMLLPFPFIFGFGVFNLKVVILMILLGVVATGLQFLFVNLSLEKIEAEISSIITTLVVPLVAIILAFIVINEQINTRTIIGGLFLVGAGVYLEYRNFVKKKPKKRKKIGSKALKYKSTR